MQADFNPSNETQIRSFFRAAVRAGYRNAFFFCPLLFVRMPGSCFYPRLLLSRAEREDLVRVRRCENSARTVLIDPVLDSSTWTPSLLRHHFYMGEKGIKISPVGHFSGEELQLPFHAQCSFVLVTAVKVLWI